MRLKSAVSAVLVCLSVAVHLDAQPVSEVQPFTRSELTVGRLLDQLRAKRNEVRPSVIAVDWADDSFLIPAAGNTPGQNQTYFRSDLTIINYGSEPQRVAMAWLPAGQNNCGAQVLTTTMNPGWRFMPDVVGTIIGASGLGAILVTAITADGEIDTVNGEIDGFSRIWTPMPNGAAGTSSQQFPAIDAEDLAGGLEAYAIGLRQDAGFRTNVGAVNLDTIAHTFNYEVYPSTGTMATGSFAVQPCSMGQTSLPQGNFGPLLVRILPDDDFGYDWSAYGSSTDNFTGDGWIVHAHHGL